MLCRRERESFLRKILGLSWEDESVQAKFVPTFRNFDFSRRRMPTHELLETPHVTSALVSQSALESDVARKKANGSN